MADRYRVFIDLPPSDLSDLDPRHAEPLWDEELFWQDYGLSRASGVCPSFGRILAAPLAGASQKLHPAPSDEGTREPVEPERPEADPGGEAHVKRDASPPSSSLARETKEAA